MRLETTAYYQGKRSVDEYTDEFRDLIDCAGYTDGLDIIVKYCKGLRTAIQAQVANMLTNWPANSDPDTWYRAARVCEENLQAIEMFSAIHGITTRSSTGQFTATVGPPGPTPLPRSIPMDVDVTRQCSVTPIVCQRCHQVGHIAPNCPCAFDVRYMTLEEAREHVQDMLAWIDMADHIATTPEAETTSVEGNAMQPEDFPTSNE